MTHGLLRQVTSPDSTNIKHLLCQAYTKREETENGGCQGLGEGGMASSYLMRTELVCDDEKVLEMDNGGGCTTM